MFQNGEPKITIVSIEGNIGSGKSTLLANLKEHYKNNIYVQFLKEPVDDWEKIKDDMGVTILEKFYKDQDKYSFSFQVMACVSRFKVLMDLKKTIREKYLAGYKKNFIIITERSLYTDKMVFAKMLFDTNKIEYVNYQIYLSLFDTFSNDFPVHKIVYVKTSPEICHNRISLRSRDGESNIPLEYLENCSNYHDNMIELRSPDCVCSEQITLNGNINIRENVNQIGKWIEEINLFINEDDETAWTKEIEEFL